MMLKEWFNAPVQVKFELEPGAKAPTKAYPTDAGWDLYMWQFEQVPARRLAPIIDTGVHVLIPPGYVGLIYPRSSMNKLAYITPIGVIDAGYTGTIKVVQWYVAIGPDPDYPYVEAYTCTPNTAVQEGDRIAQLIIHKLPQVELIPGKVTETVTSRGDKGFGSTGK